MPKSNKDEYLDQGTRYRKGMLYDSFMAEARRLFPGRPEMQHLYVIEKVEYLLNSSKELKSKMHEIGRNVANPKSLGMM